MNRRSLTFRLVVWYCGLLLLIGVSFAVATYVGFTHYLHNTMRSTLKTRAVDTAILASSLLGDREALAAAMGKRFAPEQHDRFMRILVNREAFYLSGEPTNHAFNPDIVDDGVLTGPSLQNHGGLWIYRTVLPAVDGRQMTIEVGQLDSYLKDARQALVLSLLLALPVLLIIAAFGGYWLVRKALAPVAAMITVAEALTFNSPHKRLPIAGSQDLIDDLGMSLNRLLDRLDHAYEHANRFSADAAHELRTPLAILRGELEFITTRDASDPESSTAAESALEETIRLGQLVEHLMSLAIIEGTGGKRSHHEVDLRQLAIETIDQMKLLAVDKQIQLKCGEGSPVIVLGDRERLKQALVNLIDNAIKYTKSGGRVFVDAALIGHIAQLSVRDTGIGISVDNQAHIFERFFRVDPNRGARGAGLGLAITKSICVAHGGALTVDSRPDLGSVFTIELPVQAIPVSPIISVP